MTSLIIIQKPVEAETRILKQSSEQSTKRVPTILSSLHKNDTRYSKCTRLEDLHQNQNASITHQKHYFTLYVRKQ